jgi:restriction system protein
MEKSVMNQKMFDDRDKLWVVHIGNSDKIALRARDEGFVCIGWTRMGDLSRYSTREQFKQAMVETWPNWKIKKVNSSYGQVYRFVREMRIGDPVVFPIRITSEVALGRVTSDYKFSKDKELIELEYRYVRDVDWLRIVPRTAFTKAALHSFGSFSTVSTSSDFLEEFLSVLSEKTATEDTDDESVDAGDDDGASEEDEQAFDLYGTAVQETEDYLLKEWYRTGAQFEHVVAAVMEALGYTATVTQASGDHGVDVIAHPDPLGLKAPFIRIQAKSGTKAMSEPEINQLLGSLQPGDKGIYVSLGGFTKAAQDKARNCSNLTLVDAKKFVSLFLEHYEKLNPAYRAKFPLSRVYVPQISLA